MPPKKYLIRKYSSYSNDRLLGILKIHYEYSDDHVEAVRQVIEDRGISIEEIHRYNADHVKHDILGKVAMLPMAFWEKVFFFLIWTGVPFLNRVIGLNYYENGLLTKARQRIYFSIIGFLTMTFIITLIMSYETPIILLIAIWVSVFTIAQFIERQIVWVDHI